MAQVLDSIKQSDGNQNLVVGVRDSTLEISKGETDLFVEFDTNKTSVTVKDVKNDTIEIHKVDTTEDDIRIANGVYLKRNNEEVFQINGYTYYDHGHGNICEVDWCILDFRTGKIKNRDQDDMHFQTYCYLLGEKLKILEQFERQISSKFT